MTRDLILGCLLSLSLHLLLLFTDRTPAAKPDLVGDIAKEIEIDITPPVMPPDDPEVAAVPDSDAKPLDLAPPMQPDLPQPERPDSFVQKVQPPPPAGVTVSTDMTVVPDVRRPGAFIGIQVIDPTMLDHTPVPKFQAPPQYPFEMRRTGAIGEVVVDFIVDANGEVRNAYALRSTQREFEAAAVLAVGKWKFRPGRKDGRAVPTHMQVPIVFSLNDR
jgi:protein TonB